ncbi:metallothionein-like protein 4B [Prunus avium]|uniref:Metallothionein-like protein 4B n=1 Tax=Prunus avium TaxID=42229 RepID=A0A6P5SD37_PRUAV|nr:metallothionein-like protein 4B [Prunus avium]
MADTTTAGGIKASCNDSCGCPNPCPGGVTCRCTTNTTEATSGGGDHMTCSCGEHCGCNPCTCAKSVVSTRTGKAYCKCGTGCACVSCAA